MYFQSVDELNEHVKNDHKEDNAEHICDTCSQLYCSLRVLGQVHHIFSRFLNLQKKRKKVPDLFCYVVSKGQFRMNL